ncbi:cilia- and flagella-associated protein 184 [Rhinophrynus dorsalis]
MESLESVTQGTEVENEIGDAVVMDTGGIYTTTHVTAEETMKKEDVNATAENESIIPDIKEETDAPEALTLAVGDGVLVEELVRGEENAKESEEGDTNMGTGEDTLAPQHVVEGTPEPFSALEDSSLPHLHAQEEFTSALTTGEEVTSGEEAVIVSAHIEAHDSVSDAAKNSDDEDAANSTEDTEEEESQAREELVRQYLALIAERDKVQQHNLQLQNKLYEYFRRKKGEDTRPEIEKHVSDQEQRYMKYLISLDEMKKKNTINGVLHQQQIEQFRTQSKEVINQVDREWKSFQEHKRKIALFGFGLRGASSTFVQEVDQLQAKEERKEKEVIQVRLENVKLKNQIRRFECSLRSKEELAEGLHLIDFEQLKIENQTYNEKIEERNEELLKLRKKITNTVEVLSHLKEKLQFVQAENQDKRDRLMEVEALVANKRDILTKTKQARDSLRIDNLKLRQKCGLLGNKMLLRDFEDKVDATEELSQRLESLKRHHAELTLTSKGIMKKMDEANSVMQA